MSEQVATQLMKNTPTPRISCGTWPTTNKGYYYDDKISKRHAGTTVLQFYEQQHAAAGTTELWQQRIINGQVTYANNQKPLTEDTQLRAGDKIRYYRLPWVEPDAPTYIDILYEDDQVLAINKPAGLQVLPKGLFCQRTVLGLLQQYHHQRRSLKYPNSLLPVPVHRLGRGTSGVLLCACTAEARTKLAKDFSTSTELGVVAAAGEPLLDSGSNDRPMGKNYRALASGVLQQVDGVINVPIGPVSYTGLSTGLFAASSSGKPARSLYKVLERRADSTVVEVTIFTGRPHQIRIHMAALGHPLVGDPLYGPGGVPKEDLISSLHRGALGDADAVMPGDCGYHLHSMDIRFHHPTAGTQLVVSAPVPPLLQVPADKDSLTDTILVDLSMQSSYHNQPQTSAA